MVKKVKKIIQMAEKWPKTMKKAPQKAARRTKMTTATANQTKTHGKYPPPYLYRWFAGPYTPPIFSVGSKIHDESLGDVTVAGTTDAPIAWPAIMYRGHLTPILCGDLVRAVCEEEEMAVAHYWGVSKYIVNKWREAISGQKVSSLVHTALAIKRHDPAFRKKWGYR